MVTRDGDEIPSSELLQNETHCLCGEIDASNRDIYLKFSSRQALYDFARSLLQEAVHGMGGQKRVLSAHIRRKGFSGRRGALGRGKFTHLRRIRRKRLGIFAKKRKPVPRNPQRLFCCLLESLPTHHIVKSHSPPGRRHRIGMQPLRSHDLFDADFSQACQ